MLFALDKDLVRRFRRLGFRPELTNAEMLLAVYRTDPAAVARLLPRPLRAPADPLAFAFVARYPRTNFGLTYSEGALFVQAVHRGRVGGYCLSMPVDNDAALIAGREHYGFPKKIASITLEHRGRQIVGRVERMGTEILRIELTPTVPADPSALSRIAAPSLEDGRPSLAVRSYLFKYSIHANGRRFDFLPRLIEQVTLFRPRPGLRQGAGQVVVGSSPRDPLGDVPVIGDPVAVVHGWFDNTMLPGRVVGRAWNPFRFLPYAFWKDDAMLAEIEGMDADAPVHAPPVSGRGTPASRD
jgi:acetoacetate decarboxylase